MYRNFSVVAVMGFVLAVPSIGLGDLILWGTDHLDITGNYPGTITLHDSSSVDLFGSGGLSYERL